LAYDFCLNLDLDLDLGGGFSSACSLDRGLAVVGLYLYTFLVSLSW